VSRENTDGVLNRLTPSRRSVLKAAVAGGAFAVPLIASFSMDAASATTARPERSIVSNMFCANQSAVNPTGFFIAEVAGAGLHGGTVFGSVNLLFAGGPFAQLTYALDVRGIVSNLVLTGPFGSFFVENPGQRGDISGREITCFDGDSTRPGLDTLYQEAVAGELTVVVYLADGVELSGTAAVFPTLLSAGRRLRP
jgi:hypothetical protein